MKGCVIVANGTAPRKSDILFFRNHGYQFLIAADGGANVLTKMDIFPNVVIGDMDSVDKDLLKRISFRADIKYLDRQSDTDVEKSLKYAIRRRYETAVLLGCTGDRLDHTFGNLSVLLKYFDKIELGLIHGKSFLQPVTGQLGLNTVPGETISLYGFDEKTLFSASGLKYSFKEKSLCFGRTEGTSNEAKGEEVTISVEGGIGFIIRDFQTVKQNGYFKLD